ncbi:PaaI family thioesterase [Nocardia farcinica]|uniref:PaaI family thioesterase n=1 Tax=Nocardia farcinica TaxID=37329 RepID=UPI0018944B88|nr:PaaI family thioesterase [Nocardia farcinica]MBF6230930.1 PaaI family thioesterase [Nocardia farcinica]
MTEDHTADSLPTAEHHEGGFRPMWEQMVRDSDFSRGGPYFGEFVEQVRILMDQARVAAPSDDLALELIGQLKELNAKLADAVVDEWSTPTWTRHDLPARGNVTLPPFRVQRASRKGVETAITFRTFHLGGNAAAHGGQMAVGFDELCGMAAAIHAGSVTRTASLTIDYRSITPLDKELTLRSWVENQEGRKVWVRATLHDGERLCAEAHGLFIVLRPGQA